MSDRHKGIRCPTCGCCSMPVRPGRVTHAGAMTIRVRECNRCATRIKTRETLVGVVAR